MDFYIFREKRKLSENEQIFAKSFRFCENFSENFRFRESFRIKFSVLRKSSQKFFAKVFGFCEILPRKCYFLTSILLHVYGYCLICFETLSGFDHTVGYLNNKTAVSFVLKIRKRNFSFNPRFWVIIFLGAFCHEVDSHFEYKRKITTLLYPYQHIWRDKKCWALFI
jgi:hypothetical protein